MRIYYSLLQKKYEYILNKEPTKGKILMFHQVKNTRGCKSENFCISYDCFKKLIISEVKAGKKFCSLDEIYNYQTNSDSIVLTFDDGYSDIYSNVYPLLKKLNIPFTIFITKDFIDKENYLTLDNIKELSNDPLCTIGSHTISHKLLRFEKDEISFNEIKNSKLFLEDLINKDVSYLAYPYGSVYACSNRDRKYAELAGYKMALSTINSHLSNKALKDMYFLPRINISY